MPVSRAGVAGFSISPVAEVVLICFLIPLKSTQPKKAVYQIKLLSLTWHQIDVIELSVQDYVIDNIVHDECAHRWM